VRSRGSSPGGGDYADSARPSCECGKVCGLSFVHPFATSCCSALPKKSCSTTTSTSAFERSGAQTAADTLKKYPLDAIHVSSDERFLDGAVDALESVSRSIGSGLVLVGNTMIGRDGEGRRTLTTTRGSTTVEIAEVP